MRKIDKIPEKTWFSFNELKEIAECDGKELTDKNILEQAVLCTPQEDNTDKNNPDIRFDSPNRIQLFFHVRAPLRATVKHDTECGRKKLGTLTFEGPMPLSECYVEEYMDLGSARVRDFVFSTTGTELNKELWPKFHSDEEFEIFDPYFCEIDSPKAIYLTADTLKNLYVHRSEVEKLLEKCRDIADNAEIKSIQQGIDPAGESLAATNGELAPPDTPAHELPCPINDSITAPAEPQGHLQATNTKRSRKLGPRVIKCRQIKAWFKTIWLALGKQEMKDFYISLYSYIDKEVSPITITMITNSGESPYIQFRFYNDEERLTKKAISHYIGDFIKEEENILLNQGDRMSD